MAGQNKRGLNAPKSRSSGMKGGKAAGSKSRPMATRNRPAPQIEGEKAVRSTLKTVEIKPLKVSREARRPLDGRAIDHRKQVFDHPENGR